MRLSSLKISGFKSFADQTMLNFKASRSAIVGPNGCGKSNVIDAVRWVMGESNARQLRGGQMQDVIFTGTAKRKSVGMASVELSFDNTYGKLGGAYNAYNELSIRRQMTREGKSQYFLNGTKCRRRDITDIFLGTGLGPRSYAIIEQGMINRLVDAKPEDMRTFIEEAAGVSRYQARRRETTQHLDHTTQNLSRLEDIAHELKSQLKTLKKQADASLKYQKLNDDIVRFKIEILCVQCQQSMRLQQEYTVSLNDLSHQFNLVKSEITTIEHDLKNTNQVFQNLFNRSEPLQQQYQHASTRLSEIKLQLKQQQQQQQKIKDLTEQQQQYKQKIQTSELQLEYLQQQEENLEQEIKHLENDTQQQNIIQLKKDHQLYQNKYQQSKQQLVHYQQELQHVDTQLTHVEKNIDRLKHQQDAVNQQLSQLTQYDIDHIRVLKQDLQDMQANIELTEKILNDDHTQLDNEQQIYENLREKVQASDSQIKILQQEQKNLTGLIGKSQKTKTSPTLLDALQLSDAAKPHATLIEKFLQKWLSAQVVDDFDTETARQIKPKNLVKTCSELQLSDWIVSPQSTLWHNVLILNELKEALNYKLLGGQTILTLDGYHVGEDWVVGLLYDGDTQGLLSHQIRLDEIAIELQHLQKAQIQWIEQEKQAYAQYQQRQHVIQVQQQQLKHQQHQAQDIALQLAKIQTAEHAFSEQKRHLQDQTKILDLQLQEDQEQYDHLLDIKTQWQTQINYQNPEHQSITQKFDVIDEKLQQLQKLEQNRIYDLNQKQKELQQNQRDLALLKKDISFLQQHYQTCNEQIRGIQVDSDLEHEYQTQEKQTNQLQQELKSWQIQLTEVQKKQSDLTQSHQDLQHIKEKYQAQLEEQRLAWQRAKSDVEHYQEQLDVHNVKYTTCNIEIEHHQHHLQQAQEQLKKLGAVNLAASEEYTEIAARYDELSHQMQDLENTTDQLKKAMKTIDLETKKLFMDTFDQINLELQQLFPKVFNGGEAQLVLEDDWQSGVKLMARPPGKRNSSLALLSGGEKALTALALVFAIFKLNPAPFCVLDEVDAPLDDANVQRFCNLVKELSEQVQFIYITHNKLAMTMATDLLGITMPEPGTSKLVTVDLEQAKEYGLVAENI